MQVSIIIPVHNRLDMTEGCLRTLWPTIPSDLACEVIVYDDHSTDGTAAFLAEQTGRVRIVRQSERGWFARNINIAARAATGRWLCLLNNDVILQPGWLTALLECAATRPKAGVVGNYQRFPQTGRVNHAGIVFDERRHPKHLYLGLPDGSPGTEKTRAMQSVTAACWITPADRFQALGGFDELYRNGCEDLDYCFRVRAAGDEVRYCGASRIDHYGQSTPGRLVLEEANHQRFLDRWGSDIKSDIQDFPREDGQQWPQRSLSTRLLYAAWRSPLASPIRRGLLGTVAGVRLRQRLLGLLNR